MRLILYFSATGNTRFLAHRLKSMLGDEDTDIMSLKSFQKQGIPPVDELIIMSPIHAFSITPLVINAVQSIDSTFIKKLHIINVGCNTLWINEGASLPLLKIARQKNWALGINKTVAMPLTIVYRFPRDKGSEIIRESLTTLSHLAKAILEEKQDFTPIPRRAVLLSKISKLEHQAVKLFGLELFANHKCSQCNGCAKLCPTKNITTYEGRPPKFGCNCMMCMSCIYSCPSSAITPRLSKFIPFNNGYKTEYYL